MPSKSKAQHNLMAMVANDPAAAKRVGIPQSVGEEYMQADKGKKFGSGGSRVRADLQKVNKTSTRHGKGQLFAEGGMPIELRKDSEYRSKESDEMKRKAVSGESKSEGMKKGGKVESKAMVKKEVSFMKKKGAPKSMVKHEEAEMKGMKHGGKAHAYAKGGSVAPTKMGSVKTAAPSRDGVAVKGKTKGTMVKMRGGGKAC